VLSQVVAMLRKYQTFDLVQRIPALRTLGIIIYAGLPGPLLTF
jgi:hypothetical protein